MRYSDSFGEKTSKIMLGTAYFGDGISEEDAFRIMDTYREMGGINIDTQTHMDSEKLFIVGDWWQPTQFQPAKETICLYESK